MGVGRLLACVVEENRDEKGIIWPITVAPYHVHLLSLGAASQVLEVAESLYEQLGQLGVEVLYDDRDESAGVKFNDADLLGMPIRVTVSKRSLENGGVEVKRRAEKESMIVRLDEFEDTILGLIKQEFARFSPEN